MGNCQKDFMNHLRPIVALIGRPNVGKSALFNRLIGKRRAIISEVAGTTRDRLHDQCTWNGVMFTVVDAGGIDVPVRSRGGKALPSDVRDLEAGIQEQVLRALNEADIVLFLVDATMELTALDLRIVRSVRRIKKPIILVANKADSPALTRNISHLYKLGLGDPMPISALHGAGVAELLDSVVDIVRTRPLVEAEPEEKSIAVAIVGKPNVGKSSIVNVLVNDTAVLVSPIAGTTRDTTDLTMEYKGMPITLIDTAGLRKRKNIEQHSIEQFSMLRAESAIARADVVAVVLDANDDIGHQDQVIVEKALEARKGLIFVINKWDIVGHKQDSMKKYQDYLKKIFEYCSWAPTVFVSALTKQRIRLILDTAITAYQERSKKISQNSLTSHIRQVQTRFPAGYSPGHGRIVLYGAEQIGTEPPVIKITTNAPSAIRYEYRRFLERQIRKGFGFDGTVIQIIMSKKGVRKRSRIIQ